MTLNFYLDKPKAEADTAIYLFLRTGKQTIKIKTGQYIHPKFWNAKPDRNGNHVNRKYAGHPEFNESLDSLKKAAHKAYNLATLGDEAATLEQIRKAVITALDKKQPQVSGGLLDHFQDYIDAKATTTTPGTVRNSKVVKRHLEEFSAFCRYKLTFQSIDLTFSDRFRSYLINEKRHTSNNIGKTFTILKAFMNWALDRDLHQNTTYKKFKATQTEGDTTYLTEAELMKLYHTDLSGNKKLDHVRDVFCFGCFTGQRYSDIANLKRSDIRADKWHLKTVKTDKPNQVPLNAFALAILQKYRDAARPLPVMSNQKTNDYLKELCQLLEINEPITISRRRGNERLDDTQPKYKFISTHTARRTFITLSLEKGMRPEVVMRISGHSNYATFKKYIKLSEKVTEVEMNQVWQMQPVMKVVS